MCLAIPAKITKIENHHAWVETMGYSHYINIDLIDDVALGDYILVHAGFAIQKINVVEYDDLQQIFETLE